METLETFQDQGSGAYQPEGPGESPAQEVGRETSLPPHTACSGDPSFSPTAGRQRDPGVLWPVGRYPVQDTEAEMSGTGTDDEVGTAYPLARNSCASPFEWPSLRGGHTTQTPTLLGHTAMVFQEVWHDGSPHRLLQKKQTVEDSLTPAVTQPSRKAKVPPKEVIWALAAGVPIHPGADSPQGGGGPLPRKLASFILGLVRFRVGCSDLQHTAPSTMRHTTNTLEFAAWQTKTVSATRIRKHPVPLICPKFSFTGHVWWQPLLTWWTRLSSHPAFEAIDYLIPTISKDGMGFISRPGQADRTLRWLKDALLRRGVNPEYFHDLTWHSFRVFIPDCAFQLGISRDQRRYLGNWMTESTADVYTREKRNVVVKVWQAVANGMEEICTHGRRVREDLNHPDWDGSGTGDSGLAWRIGRRSCHTAQGEPALGPGGESWRWHPRDIGKTTGTTTSAAS